MKNVINEFGELTYSIMSVPTFFFKNSFNNENIFSTVLHTLCFPYSFPSYFVHRHIIPHPWSICPPCSRGSTTPSAVQPPTSSEMLLLGNISIKPSFQFNPDCHYLPDLTSQECVQRLELPIQCLSILELCTDFSRPT